MSTVFHRGCGSIFFNRKRAVEREKNVENFGENVETFGSLFYLVELMLVMIAFTVSA